MAPKRLAQKLIRKSIASQPTMLFCHDQVSVLKISPPETSPVGSTRPTGSFMATV
jgi:hypothetical protein